MGNMLEKKQPTKQVLAARTETSQSRGGVLSPILSKEKNQTPTSNEEKKNKKEEHGILLQVWLPSPKSTLPASP